MASRDVAADRWPPAAVALLVWALAAPSAAAYAQSGAEHPRLRVAFELELFAPRADQPELNDTREAITAIPRLDWAKGPVALRGSVLLRKDRTMPERDRVDIHESYVAVGGRGVRLSAGRQFITWGRADSLRPTDVFKRHDVTDLLQDRELPVDVAVLELSRGASTLEAVWAPVFDADIYSLRADNPWTGLAPIVDVPGEEARPIRYVPNAVESSKTLRSGQAGLRYGLTAGGWDFSAMGYSGYDRIPTTIEAGPSAFDSGTVVVPVIPRHNRITVAGGDVATTLGGWGLRGEAAYTRTRPVTTPLGTFNPSYTRVTVGVDRTLSRLPLGERFTVITQYALDTTPAPVLADSPIDPRLHPFRHAVVVHATWHVGGTRQLVVKGYRNLQQRDHVVQADWSWQPRDALTISAGGDLIGGSPISFFGRFARNDRLRLVVAYAF